jgi:hypothetical protein
MGARALAARSSKVGEAAATGKGERGCNGKQIEKSKKGEED